MQRRWTVDQNGLDGVCCCRDVAPALVGWAALVPMDPACCLYPLPRCTATIAVCCCRCVCFVPFPWISPCRVIIVALTFTTRSYQTFLHTISLIHLVCSFSISVFVVKQVKYSTRTTGSCYHRYPNVSDAIADGLVLQRGVMERNILSKPKTTPFPPTTRERFQLCFQVITSIDNGVYSIGYPDSRCCDDSAHM
jgi:hypothetical protein